MAKRRIIGLLYFLLIIPHHGNNPIPRVGSWLQNEKDDGVLERDMTSSFGDEKSFEFPFESDQNSLIRDKKSLGSVSNSASRKSDKRKYKNNERQEELESENSDVEYRDENYLSGKEKAEPAFQEFGRNGEHSQYNKYKPNYNNKYQKSKLLNSHHYNNFRGSNKFMDPEENPDRYQSSNFKDDHTFMRNDDALRGCGRTSFCKPQKSKYTPDITLGVMEVLKLEGGSKKRKQTDCEESNFNDNHESKDDLNRSDKINEEETGKETDKGMAEDYYYDPESKDTAVKESDSESEEDYNQLAAHDAIYKRDDSKSEIKGSDKITADSKDQEENLKPSKEEKSEFVKNNAKSPDAVKEEHNEETDFHNANLLWKMNSNLQAKELSNVMKDSQHALEEVKLFQQKMALKNNNNLGDSKYEDSVQNKESDNLKDDRGKREDEDEQKNMKTGTDEGGGEYEDEEGKGHNDEEEYYEEVDEGDSNLKRDTEKEESKSSNSKSADTSSAEDDEDDDDELSLKSAPVENVQDQKKIQVEGEKKEKKDIRKGAKIWDQWGKWSPCSVTCGVGRSVRWRHCIGGGCAKGEKEAQIKKCTNPAC